MNSKKVPTPTNPVGVGLRSFHLPHIQKNLKSIAKKIGWFEVHSENYYANNSNSFHNLVKIRQDFEVSLHSVGNSLGSAQKLDLKHLEKLKNLADAIQPFLISDHISWGRVDKNHLNDLLPLPYTKEALEAISDNVSQMQDFLKKQILVENPSAYLAFKNPEMNEAEFVNKLCKKTGCRLLLDVNNIYVSSQNCQQFNAENYLKELDKKIVKEIHLAGHSVSEISDGKKKKKILIDTHNSLVCKEVWQIYKMAIKNFGRIPSLIEWDQDFPEFKVLLREAKKAEKILKND
ncbi:MAG: DUF692 domain-containing protein [Proteobacteria bacterium]|nr:DUF692 domain-containing protein [Pseudomonadota bacterium]